MIEGLRIKIEEPERLKIFLPAHRIIKQLPIIGDYYIYVGPLEFDLRKFQRSVVVSNSCDFNFDSISAVVDFYSERRKLSKKLIDIFCSMEKEEFWNAFKSFYYFGIAPDVHFEQSIYDLFLALSKTEGEIYQAYKEIHRPMMVIISSLLTMILKAQSYKDFRGQVKQGYLKQLYIAHTQLKSVKYKFIKFWLSERTELDFLYLLFTLRK